MRTELRFDNRVTIVTGAMGSFGRRDLRQLQADQLFCCQAGFVWFYTGAGY